MLRRFVLSLALGTFLLTGGIFACGGSGGGITIEITANTDTIHPGEDLQLNVVARDGSGNVVGGLTFVFDSSQPRYASVDSNGLVQGLYPGSVRITATADGVVSDPFNLTVDPPENSQTVRQVTQNTLADMWGDPNNVWKTTALRMVLWQRVLGTGDREIILYDNDVDSEMTVDTLPAPNNDVDFMALGSGATDGEVMASYRVNLADTMVSDDGAAPVNLGDNNQEQNSIDSGCFFFREGGGIENILRYTVADGLVDIDTTPADTVGQPISSGCQAVWERDIGMTSDLEYYDGNTIQEIQTGLPNFVRYDFALGRVVYAQDEDIFLVDVTTTPFTETQITNDGATLLDRNPRTDGNSIVWMQVDPGPNDWRVLMYDIATGTQTEISSDTEEKNINTLAIHLKQAVWTQTLNTGMGVVTDLFFHDGSGTSSGTIKVNLPEPIDTLFDPYISDGLVTWIGDDGDTEVFVME